MHEGRPEPLKAIVANPTALRVRDAKRELYRQWFDLYGEEPYVMTATQTFDAWEGTTVAVILCRPSLPATMKWSKS